MTTEGSKVVTTPQVFRLTDKDAKTIELLGTFGTDVSKHWTPIAMAKSANGVYELTVDLVPGTSYAYKFKVDGEWRLDPNAKTSTDDAGMVNNVLTPVLPTTAEAAIPSADVTGKHPHETSADQAVVSDSLADDTGSLADAQKVNDAVAQDRVDEKLDIVSAPDSVPAEDHAADVPVASVNHDAPENESTADKSAETVADKLPALVPTAEASESATEEPTSALVADTKEEKDAVVENITVAEHTTNAKAEIT
ncbi:hypothetical protein H4S08_003346, partial [Coemansia sp. RSA 1365]